jgi:hypothetical protein
MNQTFSAMTRWLEGRPAETCLFERLVADGFGGSVEKWLGTAPDGQVFGRFFKDLAKVDFDWLVRLSRDIVASREFAPGAVRLVPAESCDFGDLDKEVFAKAGEAALQAGKVGVLIFAGGAATRFWAGAADHPQASAVIKRYGGNPPKGLFPVGAVTGRSFLDLFAGEMLESGWWVGKFAPLILMAGSSTREALQLWVDTSLPAGFPRDMVRVIVQAEHPRLDMDGDLIIRPDGSLVFTGDGHGGVYKALMAVGDDGLTAVDWLRDKGVESLVLHNVDNVAARALDPVRLGWHVLGGYDLTLSAVPRLDPFEKVGIIALNADTGRVDVVEYSVCPADLATAVDADGRLLFVPAHINTNIVRLDAVKPDLPPTLYTGKEVEVGGKLVPACSHEMLNQSLAGLLDPARVGVLILPRDGYFQPTKSLTGVDSLETTREWLSDFGWD